MQTTLGGERLGSGNKQTISFRNYERSSHDLGYVWRSSMSSGTLVPFLCKLALPGDNWKINLNAEVLTLPTIGPLFGSYKVQLDVFEIPIRLYNAKLHMNKLGVGMDMKSIFIPQIEVKACNLMAYSLTPTYYDNEQINASALLKYLGISGVGSYNDNSVNPVYRLFNGVPLLAYWDIYKNYYSNKQEEIGYYIHTNQTIFDAVQTPKEAILIDVNGDSKGSCLDPAEPNLLENENVYIKYENGASEPNPDLIETMVNDLPVMLSAQFTKTVWNPQIRVLECYGAVNTTAQPFRILVKPSPVKGSNRYTFGLKQFPLENIDRMRELILQYAGNDAFQINSSSLEPYNASMQLITQTDRIHYACEFSQESLALKTYQSDLFNNWINTDWIEGAGGISELTAVDTTTGEFTIDALNIASKVYDMLNRIAVSGGTYDDWLEAVYTHERIKGVENPVYCGSLIKELAFEEVVSLAETKDTEENRKLPLGTLAGRGRLTNKHKGGEINITVNEPSYIMGLVSITPRVDYSQGNEWDVNLKTYDDFHKPALDGIGFQDLITEQLLWSDTEITVSDMSYTQFSLGKQPAWINYMTSVNKTFGSFAELNNSMFMTLNRRYEKTSSLGFGGKLKDGTTYIDPTKYNNIFAEVALDSQNFWVQIACDILARRKMSAKIIPNL